MSNEIRVIKYEGDNSTFVWKSPIEDFDSMTQLIVHESQEAVFFMNGQALDLFGAGRYTLETQNIPQIGGILKKLPNHKDGDPFHCEVYFINKAVHMGIKWGTDERIRYIDPETGIPLDIGCRGEANLAVADSRKLLVKLVGTTDGLNNNDIIKGNGTSNYQSTLLGMFRAPLVNEVKTYLATVIKEENINILEIDEKTNAISDELKKRISPKFEEYGLTIPNFYVTSFSLPEDDKNFKKLREFRSAYIAKKEAEIQSEIITAQRQKIIAENQTRILQEQAEAELRLIREKNKAEMLKVQAQAEAEAAQAKGFAEANVIQAQGIAKGEGMKAQGYTQKDVLQTEAQKAWAEGMGNIGSGSTTITGGASGGNMGSDIVSMMAQMKMAGVMLDKMDGVMNQTAKTETPSSDIVRTCKKCGAKIPENSKFCLECGEKVVADAPDNMIVCPACGATVAKGKFCLECGHKFVTVCPTCGNTIPEGAKFCLECGTKL